MTDRVGQIWEFTDGLIVLVVASKDSGFRGESLHDVVVLTNGYAVSYEPADVVRDWVDGRDGGSWERSTKRWRIG